MRPACLALAVAGAAGAAVAAENENFTIDTAAQLAALCASAPEHRNHAAAIHMCHGYLVGVHHMHTAMAGPMGGGVYCFPTEDAPSRNDVANDFVAWIAERPGMAGSEAIEAALTFAAETYPCE